MDERTTEILKRFHTSWKETERYFDDLIDNYPDFQNLIPIRNFIAALKQKRGDDHFRIGASMHTLVLSRSVEHGLRLDQKHIKIETLNKYDFEVTLRDEETVYRQYRIHDLGNARLTKLLDTLKHTLVD